MTRDQAQAAAKLCEREACDNRAAGYIAGWRYWHQVAQAVKAAGKPVKPTKGEA